MLTEKQKKQIVTKFAQFERDQSTLVEYKKRVEDEWQDIVSTLQEWQITDGDQELVVAAYKAEGYPVTDKVLRDIHRAFSATGLINSKKKSPRKDVVKRAFQKDPRVGKKRADRAIAVEKLVESEKPKAAIQTLKEEAVNRAFNFLGLLVKDNWDLITVETVDAWWAEYKLWWHSEYDEWVARQKAERAKDAAKQQNENQKAVNGK
jgi:hypothetical protein